MQDYRVELEILHSMSDEEKAKYFTKEDRELTLNHINTLEDILVINRQHRKTILSIARDLYTKYKADPKHDKAQAWLNVVKEAKLTVDSIDRNNAELRKQVRELRVNPYGKKASRK